MESTHLVMLEEGADLEAVMAEVTAMGGTIGHVMPRFGIFGVTLDADGLEKARALNGVKSVRVNGQMRIASEGFDST